MDDIEDGLGVENNDDDVDGDNDDGKNVDDDFPQYH